MELKGLIFIRTCPASRVTQELVDVYVFQLSSRDKSGIASVGAIPKVDLDLARVMLSFLCEADAAKRFDIVEDICRSWRGTD